VAAGGADVCPAAEIPVGAWAAAGFGASAKLAGRRFMASSLLPLTASPLFRPNIAAYRLRQNENFDLDFAGPAMPVVILRKVRTMALFLATAGSGLPELAASAADFGSSGMR